MWWNDLGRMDGRTIALTLLFALVPAAALLRQARRAARADVLEVWARSHFLTVPPEWRGTIERHLRRMVWVRGLGAAGGWLTGSVVPLPAGPWGGILVGYIVSTIAGELTAQRHLGAGVASLTPRRLEAYVPAAAITAVRTIAGAAVAVGALAFLVEPHRDATGGPPTATVGLALATVAVAAVGEWASRRIVARRQTAGTPELLAVDDALRSTSAHLLVASVVAAELLGLALVASGVAAAVAPPALRWGGLVLALASVVAAVATLHLLSPRPWQVQRRLSGTAV